VLSVFTAAFTTPDLRRKLLFTIAMIAIFRLGSVVPTPGVDYQAVNRCFTAAGNTGIYGLINLFSGGALLQLSVFALGIMPYITASIILQLLTVVIPRLEALKKEGQAGQAKITQYTRYLTIGLAVLQSASFVTLARTGNLFPGCPEELIPNDSVWNLLTMIIIMTAGTGVVMWLGELITDRGVGNGMSVLIFTSIIATFPAALWSIRLETNVTTFLVVCAVGLAVIVGVVFVEQSQRRIPVQYAKRMVGRRMYGGSSTYIPLKINQAGIIPVIFASSILYLPILLTILNPDASWSVWLQRAFGQTGDTAIYMVTYFLLVVFFTYFYVAITFNPADVADNMKKYGGFIPGIRAGKPTEEYLDYVLSRLTATGALYLGVIALLPNIAVALLGVSANLPFGGTSILIMVGVGLETVKQIDSQLQQRSYEGFLR
jgi:preprotein translocase subunit SecY